MKQLCLSALLVAAAFTNAGSSFSQDQQRPNQRERRPDPARMVEQFDKNGDGLLGRDEVPERMKERFDQIDADKDGKLSKEELQRVAPRGGAAQPTPANAGQGGGSPREALFRLLDDNRDGKLSADELANPGRLIEKLDADKNGTLDEKELAAAVRPAGRSSGGRPGEIITPAARGERHEDTLEAGDAAPDFTLPTKDGKSAIRLSSFRGKVPVVLVFASYT
ncbi:MAG: EF-hand domain-containing protein [Planctomycetia bacterium]|nr:EF-hand domain-containing protein [Planctomycetia bacterium]